MKIFNIIKIVYKDGKHDMVNVGQLTLPIDTDVPSFLGMAYSKTLAVKIEGNDSEGFVVYIDGENAYNLNPIK